MAKNLGGIDVIEQHELNSLPQHAASAWLIMSDIVGASYKPVAYIGTQIVKGVNHVFIAEQSIITAAPTRHIVIITINEFDGEFNLVSIEQLF